MNAGLLAEAMDVARRLGYQIREDDLDGAGGGHCSFHGKKWLLVDVTQDVDDQLRDVLDALRQEPEALAGNLSSRLATLLAPWSRAA
jgi:hypothetical protein